MNTRYEFLKRIVSAVVVTAFLVPGLFAQDAVPSPPKDAKLFAVSYGDKINRQKAPPRTITIPNVGEYTVLKGDFHIHTIFSDGRVMPQDRVNEAVDNGLDVISITDHLGSRGQFKLTEDQNIAYTVAKPEADKKKLILVHGTEISGNTMPPGHLNALFITDANAIAPAAAAKDWKKALAVAAEQGAFIQWNHPGWVSNGGGLKKDEPMYFSDFHEEARLKGHLHGIEVFANSACLYHPIAHDWCNEKDLAVMTNTDIHPSELERFGPQNPRRQITLILAKERTLESVKEAMFAKRTIGWAADMVFGRDPWIEQLFRACVEIKKTETGLTLRNLSDIPCVIEVDGKTSELPPQGAVEIGPAKKLIVANWFVGAFKPMEITP